MFHSVSDSTLSSTLLHFLSRFLPLVNGTPASQLSTPHSGKSPSPSPTSPGSLNRRRVRPEYTGKFTHTHTHTHSHTHKHTHTQKQSVITFSDTKSIIHSFYVLRKRIKPWLSIGRLHLKVTRIWRNLNIPASLVSQNWMGRWPHAVLPCDSKNGRLMLGSSNVQSLIQCE